MPGRENVTVEELRPPACVAGSGATLCAREQSSSAVKPAAPHSSHFKGAESHDVNASLAVHLGQWLWHAALGIM